MPNSIALWVFAVWYKKGMTVIDAGHKLYSFHLREKEFVELASVSGLAMLPVGVLLRDTGLVATNTVSLVGEDSVTFSNNRVGVEFAESSNIPEGVLLDVGNTFVSPPVTNGRLDLIRVDDTVEISIRKNRPRKAETVLQGSSFLVGAKEGIQSLKSIATPDNKAAEVTTGGEPEEVEAVDVEGFNTWNVTERFDKRSRFVGVHDKRTTAVAVATVTHFTSTCTQLLAVNSPLNVVIGIDLLQEVNSLASLLYVLEGLVSNNKGNFLELGNAVATSHDQSGNGRGSQSRGDSVPLLVDVNPAVPPAPGFSGSKHASSTAHVTKSSLTCTVCATSRNTRNTCNSTTSTPGLSRRLVTSFLRHGIGLTVVFGQVGVNRIDQVGANGSQEYLGQGNVSVTRRTKH